MMNQPGKILAIISIVLLLQTGCATLGIRKQANEPSIVVKELVKSDKSWDGGLLPAYPPGQPQITIKRIIIPAGARLETHTHPMINAGILISGQLKVVTVDGKILNLRAGDPIVEVVNTLHYGVNEGKVPAEIVVFYADTLATPK